MLKFLDRLVSKHTRWGSHKELCGYGCPKRIHQTLISYLGLRILPGQGSKILQLFMSFLMITLYFLKTSWIQHMFQSHMIGQTGLQKEKMPSHCVLRSLNALIGDLQDGGERKKISRHQTSYDLKHHVFFRIVENSLMRMEWSSTSLASSFADQLDKENPCSLWGLEEQKDPTL